MRQIYPKDIPQVWGWVAPLLQDALAYCDGKYTVQSVQKSILDRMQQLWVFGDPIQSAFVTELIDYPGKRVCLIFIAAGRKEDLIACQLEIEKWAEMNGCVQLEFHGRNGWERVLKDWQKTHVVMKKELGDGW